VLYHRPPIFQNRFIRLLPRCENQDLWMKVRQLISKAFLLQKSNAKVPSAADADQSSGGGFGEPRVCLRRGGRRNLLAILPHDRGGRPQPDSDFAPVVDKGALGCNSPDDIPAVIDRELPFGAKKRSNFLASTISGRGLPLWKCPTVEGLLLFTA